MVSLLGSILLCSCSLFSDNSIAFSLTNALDSPIQSVSIFPIHDPELKVFSSSLASGQTILLTLDMNRATKSDGCYVVAIVHEGITTSVEYGYYSNGYPLEKQVGIVITREFLDWGY